MYSEQHLHTEVIFASCLAQWERSEVYVQYARRSITWIALLMVSDAILLGGQTAKIAVNVWRVKSSMPSKLWVIDLLGILWITTNRYPAESFFVFFLGSNLKNIDLPRGEELHLNFSHNFLANCNSVLQTNKWKMKTLIAAFLARLFPSNMISKFFYLVSLYFDS